MTTAIYKRGILAFLCYLVSFSSLSQQVDYAATKEKVYIQTSHVFFKQGETVFFKVYVVNAKDQTSAVLSNSVHVEFVNPAGSVVKKLNYRVENGYAEGSYEFDEQAVGGIYKIRAYTTWMQNENETTFFSKEITLQKVMAPRVLMKLDFPEKGYGPGSEVVADFSMRNLGDQPIKFYPCKFTVAIDGRQVQVDNFQTGPDGKAKIKFELPAELNSNDGLLNVSVIYDSYTEAISRSIPIVLDRIDLQFMPEGGTLVQGITTNMAFKALNENGKAADIKGEVWDNRGNRIASFESYHFGMGKFLFTPVKGQTYTARIVSPARISQTFALPVAAETGVVINFSKENSVIHVKLNSTGRREVKLVGLTKNIIFYTRDIILNRGENSIDIDEKLFPPGIAQFTLFTASDMPLAERLIFLNEDKNLQVTISTDKKRYLPREKVRLTITTLDENGRPVPANLSLAVMDDKLWSFADDKQDHILSWLLMSSELQGKIEEPQFYFKKDEPKAVPALDLVMMTHGYRYFDYIDYVRQERRVKFTPEQDNVLRGIVLNQQGDPVRANVFLAGATYGDKAIQAETDDEGRFFFSHLEPNTNYYVIAQAIHKERNITIKILQNNADYNPRKVSSLNQFNNGEGFFSVTIAPNTQPATRAVANQTVTDAGLNFMPSSRASLQEVVVTGYGSARKGTLTGSVTSLYGKNIAMTSTAATALQGKVAGIEIIGHGNPGDDPKIRIRGLGSLTGVNQPLFVINGVPVEQPNLGALNPNDIESITIWKDAAAIAIYGAKAANGVVVIETKRFRGERIRFDLGTQLNYSSQLIRASGPVYSIARKFYAPRYSTMDTDERTDFRETIYWNPTVQTDREGKATVEFYNSDASTVFRAIAEGIGWNGKLGRVETTYAAQNAMSADAKIPPYLTVGDRAFIPLVLKNNSGEKLDISIDLSAPSKIRVGAYTDNLSIDAGSSQRILIPIEAAAETGGMLNFIIKNQFSREILSLPVTVADKGFPVINTFAGDSSKQYDFRIDKMLPGTLKAKLKLFNDIEGQLTDGIESMLREPHGCFEQTSSTTYPNIYVLKYLRESGKSNPEIEKRALALIEQGYNRLIGFETAQNGFEWFGHIPPREVLTAYGLLEFTDMKEFIHVDEKMLERTKKFLMKRRDGRGMFKLVSDDYELGEISHEIANIYIVYALTEAGIGGEIQLEYETAVKKALASKDGYQLSMVALAANNMKNEKDYRQLMNILNQLYQKGTLSSATSVVYSRGASLDVETAALYALALMREPTPDMTIIGSLVSRILSKKSYYGYGSTQATVLALHAIVEYAKIKNRITANTPMEFTVNSKTVMANGEIEQGLKEGANRFTVNYPDPGQTVPYSLEVSYNTLTPLNSDKSELLLSTRLTNNSVHMGETVRMEIEVANQKDMLQPMAVAKVGIPAGLSVQPWQLKEIMEKNQVAYYEIFDNYLVFYWMGFSAGEKKTINLDLKAEIPGTYKGKASTTYLYYTPEYKNWAEGQEITIEP